MSTLAAKHEVQDDGADDGEQDHKPYREIEGKVTTPEYQVSRQPVYPETAEQQEQSAEHEQDYCAADQQLSYAFESHKPILCPPHPMSTGATRPCAARSGRIFTVQLGEKALDVEGSGHHGQPAIGGVRPLVAGLVAVELDAVAVGVLQVQRLGDTMV